MKERKNITSTWLSKTISFASINKPRSVVPEINIVESEDTEDEEYLHVGVYGATKVGKSCLIARILRETFNNEHIPTVSEIYELKLKRKGKTNVIVRLYDTSMDFPAMNKLTMKKCDACIIVYSVDSMKSFEIAEQEMSNVLELKDKSFPCVLIANKNDLDNREVTFDQGLKCAVKSGASYMQVSAKVDTCIEHVVETLVKKINHSSICRRSSSINAADVFKSKSENTDKPQSPLLKRIQLLTTRRRANSCNGTDFENENYQNNSASLIVGRKNDLLIPQTNSASPLVGRKNHLLIPQTNLESPTVDRKTHLLIPQTNSASPLVGRKNHLLISQTRKTLRDVKPNIKLTRQLCVK